MKWIIVCDLIDDSVFISVVASNIIEEWFNVGYFPLSGEFGCWREANREADQLALVV